MIIEEMTTLEFSEGLKKTKTVIIPIGSIEQHGPHLPMHTDIFHACEIARRASRMAPVFVAPAINFGVCRSTADFPGTIGIRSDTLVSLLIDVAESLYRHGIRRFIFYSGHAGANHMAALLYAADDLMRDYEDTDFAVINDLDLFDAELFKLLEADNDSHAGEFETSLIMALAPELVGALPPADRPAFPRPFLVRNTRAYWKSGVWGDPGKASRVKGEHMIAILSRNLAKMAESMSNQKKNEGRKRK